MREKIKYTVSKIKELLSGYILTIGKGHILGGSVVAIALIITLTIATSSGANANIEQNVDVNDDAELALEESTEYADGQYTDGVLYAKDVYAIVVNDEDIVYVASNGDAEAVLNGITDKHKTPGSEITNLTFKEAVSIEKREFEWPAPVFSAQDAVNYVITGTTAPRTYIIKGGDNLWDIAISNGISLSALEEMNPGIDPKKLSIGKEIYLYETQPFITVSFTELVTREERIPYDVVYENADNLYRGQTQVKAVGSYGSKEVISEITKENGILVSTTVLSENIITEPVTQVSLKGTQAAPVYTGSSSGQLSSPVAAIDVISSYGSRGGRHHNGVDLKAPKGTPIYASADGVVTQAKYSGSYGNIVKVSHGSGLETYYSHCDTMLVTVGETVTKGQQIATIGRTGNATTDHVHFEVRVNGAVKNPMNYI